MGKLRHQARRLAQLGSGQARGPTQAVPKPPSLHSIIGYFIYNVWCCFSSIPLFIAVIRMFQMAGQVYWVTLDGVQPVDILPSIPVHQGPRLARGQGKVDTGVSSCGSGTHGGICVPGLWAQRGGR